MTSQEPVIKLSDLSDESLLEICKAADVIACECPGYLARILRQVRTFRQYTLGCIDQFPQDRETHLWLAQRAEQLEKILWDTTVELMYKEELIDDSQQILLNKLSARARETALKQIGQSPDNRR
ncbi:hypothetical protein J5X98_27295 [Leptothermofonsia sichuanensis E412]|uniref:hypothetical protein n=1 Tax=Leptothermofonsia sichuanensis TaxID=2917832 RepID=UPI001CA70FE8|nr:hypothetical protein [Leptothermofonsia sichuanensis]QZZ20864.1 hypothetical protein J5X98_27295 [Leptothermofonsia sichuanensis E412]